jgi:pimeloyl-ACP methyl ester carboxylesterase
MHRGILFGLCALGACSTVSSSDGLPVSDAGLDHVTTSEAVDASLSSSDAAQLAEPGDDSVGPLDATMPLDSALDCGAEQLVFQRLSVGPIKLNVGCQGSGPVIVLLHGYPEYHAAWNKLIPPLVRAGHRVIVPDQRGYNLSDKPEGVEAYAMEQLVADVRSLIEQSGSQQVLLVGHDWGGTVAWVLAHRYPRLLRGLVIMAGPHPPRQSLPRSQVAQRHHRRRAHAGVLGRARHLHHAQRALAVTQIREPAGGGALARGGPLDPAPAYRRAGHAHSRLRQVAALELRLSCG